MLIDTTALAIEQVVEQNSGISKRKDLTAMNLYPFGRALCSGILSPIYQFKVIGKENFPTEGGVLLCSNHIQ